MPVQKLPSEVYEVMVENGKAYRSAKASGNYVLAEEKLLDTWKKFPEPKHLWDSSQSLIKAISSFYWEQRKFADAENWAKELFHCELLPGDAEPYIIVGKIYFEAGSQGLAAQNLIKAYELGGRRGYSGEDPKYLKFALDQMKKASK